MNSVLHEKRNYKLLTLSKDNKAEILSLLRQELYKKFEVQRDEDLPENYSNVKPWSLLRMIEDDAMDIYQLVYVSGKFWASCGGIIRNLPNGEKIYQGAFRTLSRSHCNIYKGFGTKPYIAGLCLPIQIERAKKLGCDKFVLSFNLSNTRLYNIVTKYFSKRTFLGVDQILKNFTATSTPMTFNGVEQWLLEMKLK